MNSGSFPNIVWVTARVLCEICTRYRVIWQSDESVSFQFRRGRTIRTTCDYSPPLLVTLFASIQCNTTNVVVPLAGINVLMRFLVKLCQARYIHALTRDYYLVRTVKRTSIRRVACASPTLHGDANVPCVTF